MASADEDFPRGGKSKNVETTAKPARQHELDNLFQTHEPAEPKKRKGEKREEGQILAKKKKWSKEETLKLNAADRVEILHMKNLKVGTLLLGCVKDVTEFEVTVSLPSGILGYLAISNISDSYTKMIREQLDSDAEELISLPDFFRPGMLLRCSVVSLDSTKSGTVSIQLSVNPKEVNKGLTPSSLTAGMILSGCVDSVEDHGYLIDVGVGGVKAFLPRQQTATDQHNSKELRVGQYVVALLEEVKSEGRVVRLSALPPSEAQSYADVTQGWTLTNLLPGLLVKAQIKKVTPQGLILEFLSSFAGTVDFLHMEPSCNYKEGDEVKARLLFLEPSTRLLGLSLRSHLLQPGGDLAQVTSERIGEVLKGCRVTAFHHYSGAVLELPDGTQAFVHRNHTKEPKEDWNMNRVMGKPEHTCRIMDFSPLEQMHYISLRMSVIKAPFFSYRDIHVGQVVEGTVKNLKKGMVVKLTDHIHGMVPRVHLSDIILKNPEKKYTMGMKVKCRVLDVDPQKKSLILTRKKALVESSLPLLRTFSDARPGRVSHGYVASVKDYGCVVRFYGNVKGLVPVHELGIEGTIAPEKVFYVGQVVKAKVLNCDSEKERLLLSFAAVTEGDTDASPKAQFDFEVGKKVEARLVDKIPGGLAVAILPEEARAVLPISHLSDHVSNCPLLFEALQVGDTISNLVCVNKHRQNITVSKKPVLRASMEDGPVAKEFSDIKVSMQLIGWIKNIMPYGVFVEFPCGLVGLAPKSAMSDKFISDTARPFQLGQTVVAKVTNLDEEKGRFLVNLKVSEVISSEGEAQARLVQGQLERRAVADMMANRDDSELHQQLSVLTLGQRLTLTVSQVQEDESASLVCDDLKGASVLASTHHCIGVPMSAGQKVSAVVLHVDPLSTQVHVSLLPELVAKRKSVVEGAKYTARVQHADKDFAVISLGDTAQLTVIQTANNLNDSFRFEAERLLPGRYLTVTVTEPSCEDLEGLPLVVWEVNHGPLPSALAAPPAKKGGQYRYGDLVTGKVKSVKPTSVTVELEGGDVGSVHVSEVQESVSLGTFPTSRVKVGSQVTARVIGGREARSYRYLPFSHPNLVYNVPELSLLPRKLQEDVVLEPVKLSLEEELMSYKVGQEVTCFVSKYNQERKCLEVTVSPSVAGFVDILFMAADPKTLRHPQKLHKLGQAVSAKVVDVSLTTLRLSLSLIDPPKLERGSVSMGIVQSVKPQGLGVRLPLGAKGTVAVVDLADSYKQNPLQSFKKGQLVSCYVLGEKNGQWQLSLRPSRLSPENACVGRDPELLSVEDLNPGQILRGYIKSVGELGVNIRLSTNISGRVQFKHATKYKTLKISSHNVFAKHVPVNTLVTTMVLSVDAHNEQVDLSLLTSHTRKPDLLPESLGLPLRLLGEQTEKFDASRKRKSSQSQEETLQKPSKKRTKKKSEDNDSGVEVYFREEEEGRGVAVRKSNLPKQVKGAAPAPARLQVSGGFSWDAALSTLKPASAAPEAEDSSEEEDQEDQGQRQKTTRYERETEKRQAEKALSEREAELMDPAVRPQDAGSFERLLLASPDSSLLWLQYMAFHLQATQIEQARAVAERAIKTISFREEQEKLNVWVALLNLENLYGSEDSLKKVFERALQFCEPMPVYLQMADIYAKSGKTKEAENLYKKIVKRFRQEKTVWLSYASFLLQQGQSDACSALLQRALNSLPTKENVDVIAKFAQLEFRFGDVEKGKAMLEKVLSSYPKRTDLWSVFIDLMVKHGSQKEIRALFDRVIHLSVTVKRIKFFFKRYLEYEKKNGSPESVQAVKEKALEYVENKAAQAAR